MKTSLVAATLLAALALALCGEKAGAQTMHTPELYPGVNNAIAETLAAQRSFTYPTEKLSAEEPKRQYYTLWLYLGGRSKHDTGNMPNNNVEFNPAIGGAITTENSFYGIRPIMPLMHVDKNSKKGRTDVFGLGLEACYENDIDLCGSLSRVRVEATDPTKNRKVSGKATMPTTCIGKGRYRICATKMAPKVSYVYFAIGF